MGAPTVSVVIPTFNSAATVVRALESVIAQSTDDWELIIVDDGSSDATTRVLAPRVANLGDRGRLIRQRHGGSSVARNTGIDACRGRFIAFLDADDEFMPHKLRQQLRLFELRSDLGLVYSDFAYIDLGGRRHASVLGDINRSMRPMRTDEVGTRMYVCGPELLDRMIGRYIVSPITALVRRDVLGSHVRFPPGQQYSEEWIFFLEVVSRCRAGYVAEALSLHHHTRGSLSRTSSVRNNVHQARVLERILTRFPHASGEARAEARGQLAQCFRQLGVDCYKQRRHRDAASYFRKALSNQFDLRGLVYFAQALGGDWAHPFRKGRVKC